MLGDHLMLATSWILKLQKSQIWQIWTEQFYHLMSPQPQCICAAAFSHQMCSTQRREINFSRCTHEPSPVSVIVMQTRATFHILCCPVCVSIGVTDTYIHHASTVEFSDDGLHVWIGCPRLIAVDANFYFASLWTQDTITVATDRSHKKIIKHWVNWVIYMQVRTLVDSKEMFMSWQFPHCWFGSKFPSQDILGGSHLSPARVAFL